MACGCSGVCGFMRKRLINEKFGDLSTQQILTATGDGSADVAAGNGGPGDCANGENECDFKIWQSTMLHIQ